MASDVQIQIDAGLRLGDLPHNWNYIGYDEINYTYTPEGEALLAKFAAMQEKPYYVRAHHLFCTGNGHAAYKWGSTNCYLEDEDGQPLYDWTFVDLIFDTILKHHCKPFVELGFMPLHLADPACYDNQADVWSYRDYKAYGWACPPKDYQRWHDLVFNLVGHCLERYGQDEIITWYWELWNEPDLNYYWGGSIGQFNRLYDHTAAAVKAACPDCCVGGPGTTNPRLEGRSGEYLDKFLDHCTNGTNTVTGETGTPLDFISFHVKGGGYRPDPLHRKQNPPSVQQILQDVQTGYQIISKYPGYDGLECILSEIDPDGWAAGGVWDNVNLNFRNTEYYASFVAAAFDKVSQYARLQAWDLRLLSWAFMFVGERCFEGTRAFSTQGIDKAILNLFRLYAKMGNQALAFTSSGSKDPLAYSDKWGFETDSDVSGFATLSGSSSLQVLIYNHHDDFERTASSTVDVEIGNLPFESDNFSLTHYRVDAEHSNAYAEWLRQDRPMYPTPEQYEAIKARDSLEMLQPPRTVQAQDGTINLHFDLPNHAISLLVIEETA